ncbi:MAG: hypothetical protein WEA29_08255 [Acidimicrobiia bacterium]
MTALKTPVAPAPGLPLAPSVSPAHTRSPAPGPARDLRRRAARQRRGLLIGVVTVAFAWSLASFFGSGSGGASGGASLIPGLGGSGQVAEVTPVTPDTVTVPTGAANLQAGVQFARVDVAANYHQRVRISLSWTNGKQFSVQTNVAGWQISVGLYYPVRTTACSGSDEAHAVTVAISSVDHCFYRDITAIGPGVAQVQNPRDLRGTQLLAVSRIVASLRPQIDQSAAGACTTIGTTPCYLDGNADKRQLWVIASLLNPGNVPPPGSQPDITLDLHIKASTQSVGG